MRVIMIDESTGNRVFSRKEVADLCGVSPQTIRLWEDAKKIPASTRDENGYRYWTEQEVNTIREYAGMPVKERRKL